MSIMSVAAFPVRDALAPVADYAPPPRALREIRQPGSYAYVLSPYTDPIASVRPGETVAIHTADCFGDRLVSVRQVPSATIGPQLNPQTGPIYLECAEPGDTL